MSSERGLPPSAAAPGVMAAGDEPDNSFCGGRNIAKRKVDGQEWKVFGYPRGET